MFTFKNSMSFLIVITLLIAINDLFAQSDISENDERKELKRSLNFDDWPGKTNEIRNGINLSNLKIPVLVDTHEIKPKYLFFVSKKDNGELFVKYRSQWHLTKIDFTEITLSFYKSGIEAHENLIDQYMLTPLSLETRKISRDKQDVVGDVSFYNGRLFIRNNIIVKIYAEGELISRIASIAKAIDAILLSQEIVQSYDDITPRIQKNGDNVIVIEP